MGFKKFFDSHLWNYIGKLKMITWNWFDTYCKNEWAIFTRLISLTRGGGVTSTHNKRRCPILTKKVAPKNPGTYLKLRSKNPGTYQNLTPKNPGTQNARLSFYMRKLTTQIRKSLVSTPRFSFTYFIKGFYCFMMFVQRFLNFPQPLSV